MEYIQTQKKMGAINVRCDDRGDDGDLCRRALIHFNKKGFAVKWFYRLVEGAYRIPRQWWQSNEGREQRLMLISHVHNSLRSRRAASFAVMSLINNMMRAQLFMICHLVEASDMLGGGTLSK
jgi:hypothetical protein